MKNLRATLSVVVLVALALVLVLETMPAQAARINLKPAINLGPLVHRDELRATVQAKAKVTHVELRIDGKKVQPWVKQHAGWKYNVRYSLSKLSLGKHKAKLTVLDQKNRSNQRQWQFQKLAQLGLTVDRSAVQPGEKVVLKGQGFTPETAVVVGMGGLNTGVGGHYGSAIADSNGAFTVEVTLDKYPDGSPLHAGTVTLVSHTGEGKEKASVNVQILPDPGLTLDRSTIKPGDEVRVSGGGFTPGVHVSIGLGGPNTGASGNYGSAIIDSTGAFALTVRLTQLPDGSPLHAGTFVLIAHTADSQEKATAQIQVLADPSITVNRGTIKAGDTVAVAGKGFTPGAPVAIALGGINTGASGNYGNAVADSTGRFSMDVTLARYPDGSALQPGTIVLLAHTPDFAEKATAQIQVQANPTLSASKTVIRVGEWIVLSGQGYTPGKVVTIGLAGAVAGHGDRYGTAAVDASGRFSTQLFLGRYPDGTPLPPGTIALTASTADGERATISLQLVANPVISISKTSITPGETVTLHGEGFLPGSTVILGVAPDGATPVGNYGVAQVDANGRFVLTAKLAQYPNGTPIQAGPLVLVVRDLAWNQRTAIQIQVVNPVPYAPTDLRITSVIRGTTSAQQSAVGLQWRDNTSDETAFRVQATFTRKNGGTDTQSWVLPANTTAAQVSFVAGGINPIGKACFTVTAVNGQGNSAPSNEACALL